MLVTTDWLSKRMDRHQPEALARRAGAVVPADRVGTAPTDALDAAEIGRCQPRISVGAGRGAAGYSQRALGWDFRCNRFQICNDPPQSPLSGFVQRHLHLMMLLDWAYGLSDIRFVTDLTGPCFFVAERRRVV